MPDSDLTVAILREIRDEIKANRTETTLVRTELGARIEQLGSRVDVTNERLEMVEHTLRDLAEQMLSVTRYVKGVANRHDDAIEDLRIRVAKLEAR